MNIFKRIFQMLKKEYEMDQEKYQARMERSIIVGKLLDAYYNSEISYYDDDDESYPEQVKK